MKKTLLVLAFAFALVGASNASAYTFSTDLSLGSTHADVSALQDMLVAGGYLQMPAGVSKGYFGTLTKAAVQSWQAANSISPAAGYFGPISRARASMGGSVSTGNFPAGCTSAVGYSVTTGVKCSTTTSTPNPSTGLSGGAGDITITERSSGVQDEVLEGEEEVSVLGFEVDAEGSDIAVTSVKVEFTHTGAGSTRLNRYVDEVQVMMGGEVIGTVSVDDFKKDGTTYSRSISVEDAVIGEDDTEDFHVSVTAVNNVDSDDLSENWKVELTQVRFEDATGAILTDSVSSTIDETFTFEDLSSTGDVELTVREDDDSINDAHTVQVKDSSDTNDVEILSFEIEADGSDLELIQLIIDITSSGAGVTEIANDFRLLMDGEEVGTLSYDLDKNDTGGESSASSTDTAIALIFEDLDDDDIVIEEGDTVTFTLEADINDVDGAFTNGDYFSSVSLVSADVDAEDQNGDAVTDLTGSAEATNISFAATGIMLSTGDSDSSSVLANIDTTTADDQGKFVVNFTVTAFDEPAFIALTATTTAAADADAAGAYAYVESVNNNDVVVSTGTTSATLELVSGGTVTGNYVKINSGSEAKFKVTVYHDAAAEGNFRAQLGNVNFAATAVAGTSYQLALPTSDYQSPSEQVKN